jgi:uncharacterized protein YggE
MVLYFSVAPPAVAADAVGGLSARGSATVAAEPDVAFVTLHIREGGMLMEDALKSASAVAEKVTEAIRSEHEEVISIQESVIELKQKDTRGWNPDGDSSNPEPIVILRIRVEIPPDQDLAVSVVDAGIRAGASLENPFSRNWVGVPSSVVLYGLRDSGKLESRALALAMTDARQRAEVSASHAGAAIGQIIGVGCHSKACGLAAPDVYTGIADLAVDHFSSDPNAVTIEARICVEFELLAKE